MHHGGLEIFLVASCHGNRDKLRPDGPLGSYADFTMHELRNQNVSIGSSVGSKQLLCFVHGQGKKKANKDVQQTNLSGFLAIPLYCLR